MLRYGKEEIYRLLKARNIPFEAIDHPAVYTMGGLDDLKLPEEGNIAKNLFLRDGKKRNYFIVVYAGDERVDLKNLGSKLGYKGVSFAPEKYLEEKMNLYTGAVSPLGVLNDESKSISVYVDKRFRGQRIAVHPNDNTASVWLNCDDMMQLLRDFGSDVEYLFVED